MHAGYRTIRRVKQVQPSRLSGGCYVLATDSLAMRQQSGLRWARVIGRPEGARKLSQFLLQQDAGPGPVVSAADHDAVLFILDGSGEADISGERFPVAPQCGVFVRRGEAVRLRANEGGMRWLLTCCPAVDEPVCSDSMLGAFDRSHPQRIVAANASEKQAAGERFFKLLVGPEVGSREVTQFIGMIPESKAPEHFHLYEEAIYVLRGTGRLWAGEEHTPVGPGSSIFLPIRQPHCLQCEDAAGMDLVGVFYPAGSPAVNYGSEAGESPTA